MPLAQAAAQVQGRGGDPGEQKKPGAQEAGWLEQGCSRRRSSSRSSRGGRALRERAGCMEAGDTHSCQKDDEEGRG